MTATELIYYWSDSAAIRSTTLRQIRDLESAGDDPALLAELEHRLDVLLAIDALLWLLPLEYRWTLDSLYVMPGMGVRCTGYDNAARTAPAALQAMLALLDSQRWDGSYYRRWRSNLERLVKIVWDNLAVDPDGDPLRGTYLARQ